MNFRPNVGIVLLILSIIFWTKPLKASIFLADSTESKVVKSIAMSISSRGLGLETGFKFGAENKLGFRANVSYFIFDRSQHLKMDKGTSIDIFPTIKTLVLGGLIDYYPFKKQVFRLTSGLSFDAIQNYQVAFSSTSGLNLGGLQIASDDFGSIHFGMRWNALRPYIGFGFGRSAMNKHLGFGCDMGMAYMGHPTLRLNYEGFLETTTIDEEIKKIESNMRGYSYYPYLAFQLRYNLCPKKK